ncbi:cadherin-like beta sandwich domain-containing protein [Pelotomaculum terephthalicicum JT]|uniref:cadherin-like beta sandwich domain-containing protein n=1 Tax=Pelotomaculum terephthalicicum TaxID=206393 RepID=UPI0009C6C240|nr:cadherin-like beta sandwich domain-containing protein [Pelotomaculum terephthalicicum]MCG9969989.1 cadherin-like beta sandwich domain-containing protein [Pelotomaculum terephthalicicum JT]OPX86971.1 MAG: Cadherin-like beta sandwich domain protein [Pelotomaculum sp. PtaB.Bin104]
MNSITVTPFPADNNATVTVNGEPVTGGQVSPPINLNVGANSINIVVTAQDGISTKMYTITVNRAAKSRDRDRTVTPPQGDSTSMNIKASTGGKVSLDDVAAEIPTGTLPADATVSIKTLSQDEANRVVPEGLRVKMAGAVYEITTTGERQFGDNYITIKLAYDPAGIAEGEFPAVHYYDEKQGKWIRLETQLVQEDDRWYAVTRVNHLTMFAVFSTAAEPEASTPAGDKKVITLTVGQTLAGIE